MRIDRLSGRRGRFLAYHSFESGITIVDARGRRDYEFAPGQYSPGSSMDPSRLSGSHARSHIPAEPHHL
jgi:hypothetical protein